jgi:hypothetical protein
MNRIFRSTDDADAAMGYFVFKNASVRETPLDNET